MRSIKILAIASVIAVSGVSASAGGIQPSAPDTTVVIPNDAPPAPVGTINSGYIVLGLLAALVAASASF